MSSMKRPLLPCENTHTLRLRRTIITQRPGVSQRLHKSNKTPKVKCVHVG